MTGREICSKAIEVNGKEVQARQMMEELAELIVAEMEDDIENIKEELGDVLIMCMQMGEILGIEYGKEEGSKGEIPSILQREEIIKESAKTIKQINKWLRGKREGIEEQIKEIAKEVQVEIIANGWEEEVEEQVKKKLKRLAKLIS